MVFTFARGLIYSLNDGLKFALMLPKSNVSAKPQVSATTYLLLWITLDGLACF
ncbi:hypothetical protein J582_3576 [Acinetobacter sp. 1566109]|nr:hypothetical protein J582_3576 [Acinetobacter sp. 1566109]